MAKNNKDKVEINKQKIPFVAKEFERYSRQMILGEIGYEGQTKLKRTKVAIVGLGGLGSPVSIYLTAAGIGELVLLDKDFLENSNLQRQIVHHEQNIGMLKTESAKQTLKLINQYTKITSYNLSEQKSSNIDFIEFITKNCSVIIDCSDNFNTRYLLNKIALRNKKILISGAAIGMSGQATSFNFSKNKDISKIPCYNCLFPESVKSDDNCNCQNSGILAPVVGIIGSIQATEAIKAIIGLPILEGKLLLMDSLNFSIRIIEYKKDKNCNVCGMVF